MRMGDWQGDGPTRKPTRSLVSSNGAARLRVRSSTKPTAQDLKLVQAYLAREIKRLQTRHAVITRRIAGR
jgi:hypothetical protein